MRSVDEVKAALPSRLARWAAEFVSAAQRAQVDPLMLAAICDRESLGGDALIPKGPAGTGDFEADPETGDFKFPGHGRGLMQIDDRAHPTFTSTDAWKDPQRNIDYAANVVLRPAVLKFRGSYPCALAAYNAGSGRVAKVLRAIPVAPDDPKFIAALDAVTARHNYVSDVLDRYRRFVKAAEAAKGAEK